MKNKNKNKNRKNSLKNLDDFVDKHQSIYDRCPRIKQLGLTIVTKSPCIPGIDGKELAKKLGKRKSKIFSNLFGVQTVGENGMYYYDVEAVLERMFSGSLKGTQLYWD